MSTSSTNTSYARGAPPPLDNTCAPLRSAYPEQDVGELLNRLDADDAAVSAVVLELHASGDLGEDRVVLAEARVQAGAKPPTALAHDDRAAGDEVAVVRLHAETLRVGIAAVA